MGCLLHSCKCARLPGSKKRSADRRHINPNRWREPIRRAPDIGQPRQRRDEEAALKPLERLD